MTSFRERDTTKSSPLKEVAVVIKQKKYSGMNNQKSCFSSLHANGLVFGKSASPIDSASGLGQSLLVTGHDRRTVIQDPSVDPWRKICALEIIGKDGSALIGTGWLAGPRLVITAGHCVFNSTYGGWIDSVRVIPGRNQDSHPYKEFHGVDFYALEKWVSDGDENSDVGAILLSEDVGSELGYFSFGVYADDYLRTRMVNISGYPASAYGEEQMHHANRLCEVKKHKIYYDVDTEGGQSGSPIWIYPDEDTDPVVVGIHSNGIGLTSYSNSGVRITAAIAETISYWQEKKR